MRGLRSVALLIILVAFFRVASVQAQSDFISGENINRLAETGRLGSGTAHTVAWSPDGHTLTICSSTGIWLYDADQLAKPRQQITRSADQCNSDAMMYSPDGKLLLFVEGELLSIFDVQPGQVRHVLSKHISVASVAFSPDSHLIAYVSGDDPDSPWDITVWDIVRNNVYATLHGHKNKIWGLAFKSDGKRLASFANDNTIRLWSMISKRQLTSIRVDKVDKSNGRTAGTIAFGPDGKTLATADTVYDFESKNEQSQVRLWNIDTLSRISTFNIDLRYPVSAHFAADGHALFIAGLRKFVVWNIQNIRADLSMDGTSSTVTSDLRSIAYVVDGSVLLWSSDKVLRSIPVFNPAPLLMRFSPDSKLLVSVGDSKTIQLWDTQSNQLIRQIAEDGYVNNVTFSADGKRLISVYCAAEGRIFPCPNGQIHVWDWKTGESLEQYSLGADAILGAETTFSGDGRRFAYLKLICAKSACAGHILVADTTNGQTVVDVIHSDYFQFDLVYVPFLKLSDDSSRLTISPYPQIALYDLSSKTKLFELGGISPAFRPNSTLLAFTQLNRSDVGSLALSNGGPEPIATNPDCQCGHPVFSPDGKYIAAAQGNDVLLLDSKTLKQQAQLNGIALTSPDRLHTLLFNRDSSLLVGISEEGRAEFWNIQSHQLSRTLSIHQVGISQLRFATVSAESLIISPDGTTIATLNKDETISLWRVQGTYEF